MTFLPGTKVLARGIPWETVYSEAAGEQQRVRLRCLYGDLRGLELDLLHPFESIEPLREDFQPEKAGLLPSWMLYHEAFLLDQVLGPTALSAAQPGRLKLESYQLVPVMRAIRMSRPRLLLADGVGLGKTVQAGLVMSEMIARRRAHRILVVTPAGPLLRQWDQEMKERFGLRFQNVQSWSELQEERRRLELGTNPFDHLSLCLLSMDFAKQEKVLQDLERSAWDLVVIDEAHHCVRMGNSGDNEDSRRRRLAEVLARQSDGLLLLTATPHDGYDPHFASLMELLDPSLVDGRGGLRGDSYKAFVVRRLKKHIRTSTGQPMFQEREVHPRAVKLDRREHAKFAAAQEELLKLVAPRLRAALRFKRFDEVLAFFALLKRSVSTATACRSTLQKVLSRYSDLKRQDGEELEDRRERLKTLKDYRQKLERQGALNFEEEQDQVALEADDIAAELFQVDEEIAEARRDSRRSRDAMARTCDVEQALSRLLEDMDGACAEDPKLAGVLEEIKAIRSSEPEANVLVYTEYTDSQDALVAYLEDARARGYLNGNVLTVSGKDGEDKRLLATARFTTEESLVLVSTDATAEGLNLHAHCHHLVHLELPYNPNRLEQRNGRIDRYGQTRTPHVRYLYLAGTFEERLLLRLLSKFERQRSRLTFMPNTLGLRIGHADATASLLQGLLEEENSLFLNEPVALHAVNELPEESNSQAYRELLADIDRAMAGFDRAAKTHDWFLETGIAADESQTREADEIHKRGQDAHSVDLEGFVVEALRQDGGDATRSDEWTRLRLPTDWQDQLEGASGYAGRDGIVWVTTNKTVVRTSENQPVSYLGRAHPLVRKALDRTRNLQFGGGEGWLDRRVSAASSVSGKNSVLLTFLCAVASEKGNEYESVIAILADAEGNFKSIMDSRAWQSLIGAPVPTKGLWASRFRNWVPILREKAGEAASTAFQELALAFRGDWKSGLGQEIRRLELWIKERAQALCGEAQAEQMALFGAVSVREGFHPRWRILDDPRERLLALAQDGSILRARRNEAEGVVKLFDQKKKSMEDCAALRFLSPMPLGLLMLVGK